MTGKRPAIMFYTRDWLTDLALKPCSLAARGLWIEMICHMHQSPRYGYLQHRNGSPITTDQLARMTGCSVDEVADLLQELDSTGVYSRTDDGVIFCRRMVRDETERSKTRSRVMKHREKNGQCNGRVTDHVTPVVTGRVTEMKQPSSFAVSSSVSSSEHPPSPRAVAADSSRPLGGESDQIIAWFEEWWASYPSSRHQNRPAALKQFRRALASAPDQQAMRNAMKAGLLRWLQSEQWSREDGRFIPAPDQWLRNQHWNAKDIPSGRKRAGNSVASPAPAAVDPRHPTLTDSEARLLEKFERCLDDGITLLAGHVSSTAMLLVSGQQVSKEDLDHVPSADEVERLRAALLARHDPDLSQKNEEVAG